MSISILGSMSSIPKPNVHGTKGVYVGGDWIPIEECADHLYIPGGVGGEEKAGHCKRECKACPRSRSANCAAKKGSNVEYDIVVIGAGCIGGIVARELSKTTASVLLLEAADDVTQGTTKGNSGIVHAGYNSKAGSNRAKFAWPGNQMFPQLDRELHFGYERNGSMVLATNEEEEAILEELVVNGEKNGVKNLRIIDREEIVQLEPYINENVTKALHSPDAGTIVPYEFAIALCENAVDNGVELRIRREVVGIDERRDGSYELTVKHWEPTKKKAALASAGASTGSNWPTAAAVIVACVAVGFASHVYVTPLNAVTTVLLCVIILAAILYGAMAPKSNAKEADTSAQSEVVEEEHSYSPSPGTVLSGTATTEKITCGFVVNCAGCNSDKIANMVGDYSFKITPRLGEYLLLHKREGHKARHTLFPAPHPVLGKGVLVQSTLWGNLVLGPTARDTMKQNESGEWVMDDEVTSENRDEIMSYILTRARKLVPSINPAEVIHTFSGARAKSTRGDWVIEQCATSSHMIHVAGIDSPGIAGCPAIAVEVVRLLAEAGAPVTEVNPSFNPHRAPLIRPKNVWKGIKAGPLGKYTNPEENVVCKCEKVTEAEVIEALHRSLPIDSSQAIRKRTRAGMGHCQGDPANYDCEARVCAIIARELGVEVSEVGTRPWPASSMLSERWIKEEEKEHIGSLGK